MHTDEAVNASLLGEILAGGAYHYDNRDRHGPALSAIALPVAHLCGAWKLADLDEATLRLVPALIGTLAILLYSGVSREIGVIGAVVGALLWAVSPLPLYFSRYFIHEILFVTATLGFLLFGWRALAEGSHSAGTVAGGCAGIMLACKETAVLSFAGALLGILWCVGTKVRCRLSKCAELDGAKAATVFAVGFLVFVPVVLAFYSWGGLHWRGVVDLASAIPHLMGRASGEGHEKAAWYYFALLGDGMAGLPMLALALVGGFNAFLARNRPSWEQFLVAYALAICTLYSAIPYKTPWLALNLWLPFSLLAGCGISALWSVANARAEWLPRSVFIAGALAFAAMLSRDSWQRVYAHPADERNPYAYAHTGEDLIRLPDRVTQLARENGKTNADIQVAVVATDPWPIPWYLRRFAKVGYWQTEKDQAHGMWSQSDLIITSQEAAQTHALGLKDWRPEYFGVRPGVLSILWSRPGKP